MFGELPKSFSAVHQTRIHSEYDVVPEELGRYVEMRGEGGEEYRVRRKGKVRLSEETREEWKRRRERGIWTPCEVYVKECHW